MLSGGDKILEDELEVIPQNIPDEVVDTTLCNLDRVKKYFSVDAWTQLSQIGTVLQYHILCQCHYYSCYKV